MHDAALIKEINRIYHEHEAAVYDAQHPEIFERERHTWKRLAGFIPKSSGGRYIIDVGSGTGFVFEILVEHLGATDTFMFTDISPKMLERAKEKFLSRRIRKLAFIVSDADMLPVADGAADAITVNSVLHHLPDSGAFFREVNRVLKPGGLLLIAHEPNRAFWKNPVNRLIVWVISKWRGLKKRYGIWVRGLEESGARQAPGASPYEEIYRSVNAELLQKGFITASLLPEEIQSYVDAHSPTASARPRIEEGFVPDEIPRRYLLGYRIISLETSAHLGKFSAEANPVFSVLENILRRLLPRSGSSFTLVIQKPYP